MERWLSTDGAGDGFESYDEAFAAFPTTPIADRSEGMDMLYSSGTTGRPKGVKHPLEMKPLGSPPPLAKARSPWWILSI